MIADFPREAVIVYTNLEPVPFCESLLSDVGILVEDEEGTFIFKLIGTGSVNDGEAAYENDK